MDRRYKLRRMLGKILYESQNYLISSPVLGDTLEVLEKASARTITPSARQREHLEQCRQELARIQPDTAAADSEPLHLLIEDFANAVFHNGQHLERAFFTLSPKSRACSALARAGINEVARVESDDPFYDKW